MRESRPGLFIALFERQINSSPRHLPPWVKPTYYWGSKNPVQGEEGKKEYPPPLPCCSNSCERVLRLSGLYGALLYFCFDVKTDMSGRILYCIRVEKKKEHLGEISTVGLP